MYPRRNIGEALQDPERLLISLRGQRVVLPDLDGLFQDWPTKVNPNLSRLRQELDIWLERCHFSSLSRGSSD